MKPHILIVEARFYEELSDELAKATIFALEKASASYERVVVSGSLEIPPAIAIAHQETGGRTRHKMTASELEIELHNREMRLLSSGGLKLTQNPKDLSEAKYDGYIALGVIIRGETQHYDYVCAQSQAGLMQLATREALAIGNGIVMAESKMQAKERCDMNKKNKAAGAVKACLSLIKLKSHFAK